MTHHDTTEHAETFWDRLKDVNAGMLGAAPDWRVVPMSHYADPENNVLWFITADGVDLVEAVKSGPAEAVHVVSGNNNLYARINGRLSLSDDKAKLDEIWNAVADAWFEDGKKDADLRLLRFDLTDAEVWATSGAIGFLYQIARAKLTGEKPDMGEHFTVSF